MMAEKRGDLEITIVEARNLGVKNKKELYCTIYLPHNKTVFTETLSKDGKWNQTFPMELWSLDNEELLVRLYSRKKKKRDMFLGQIQIPVKALSLTTDAEWYYLSDKPTIEYASTPQELVASSGGQPGTISPRKKPDTKAEKKYIVTGELLIKLKFIHRLVRAKSKATIRGVPLGLLERSPALEANTRQNILNSSTYSIEPVVARVAKPLPTPTPAPAPEPSPSPRNAGGTAKKQLPSLPIGALTPTQITPPEVSPRPTSPTQEVVEEPSHKEAIIIDEALKDKQQIVRKRLDQGRELVRNMTVHIKLIETTKGEKAAHEEKLKLEEIKKDIMEMEQIEKSIQLDNAENTPPAINTSGNVEPSSQTTKVSFAEPNKKDKGLPLTPKISHDLKLDARETAQISHNLDNLALNSPALHAHSAAASSPVSKAKHIKAKKDKETDEFVATLQEEIKNLNSRVKLLEMELEKEKTVSQVMNSKNSLLEKEVTRLNGDVDKMNFEREKFEKEERWREKMMTIMQELQKPKGAEITEKWKNKVTDLLEAIQMRAANPLPDQHKDWRAKVITLLEKQIAQQAEGEWKDKVITLLKEQKNSTSANAQEFQSKVIGLLEEQKKLTTELTIEPTTPTKQQQQQQTQPPTLTNQQSSVFEKEWMERVTQMLETQQKRNENLEEKIQQLTEQQQTQQPQQPPAQLQSDDQVTKSQMNEFKNEILQSLHIVATSNTPSPAVSSPKVDDHVAAELSPAAQEEKKRLELRKNMATLKLKEVQSNIESSLLHQKRLQAELAEKRVLMKEEYLIKVQQRQQALEQSSMQLDDDILEDDLSESEDESEEGMTEDERSSHKKPAHITSMWRRSIFMGGAPQLQPAAGGGPADAQQLDAIVGKLEKLDKLDELLRKLDNLKLAPSGGGPVGDGKKYTELKAELEQLQTIIFDSTNKFTEKEKEDANIRYEKASQALMMTDEYKKEIAAAAEEKRKKNEPLNKDALERMLKIYGSHAKGSPETADRLQQHPELTLIGMDPKAILSKHQNDFTQYLLRNLELDELRAIRASLPKFRNDQKKQLEWVDGLEQKIEQQASNPAPPPKPAPKPSPIKFKPKAAPSGAVGGNAMFAELLQKRKKLDE